MAVIIAEHSAPDDSIGKGIMCHETTVGNYNIQNVEE